MQIDVFTVLAFVVPTIITTAVTFYLKDWLQTRMEYSKLRKKLERVAGKHATIVYNVSLPGLGSQLFKIENIDEYGITIRNELQTIFVPAKKLLQSEMIVPCDNYEQAKLAKMRKDMEQYMDSLMKPMFDKMFPAMLDAVKDNFIEDMFEEQSQVSAIIGVKIQKVLEEEGFEIKKSLSGCPQESLSNKNG